MLKAVVAVALLALLSACSSGTHGFRVAKICVTNKEDALRLVHEMKQIANEEKMEFLDGSAATARGAEIIGYADPGRADGSVTIHIAVERIDGMGVTVANFGLPGYQMAIGFSEGSNRSEGTRFADKVIDRLSRLGRLEELPFGSSVMPDPKCGSQQSDDPQRPLNP
jgi:hypothetical protein